MTEPENGNDPQDTSAVDEVEQSDLPPIPKRFRAATDEELDPQSFMVGDDRAALRAILRGGSVGADRADGTFIGRAIYELARALRNAAEVHRQGTFAVSNPLLQRLAFTESVVLEFTIGAGEEVRRGLDDQRHSPTIDAARSLSDLIRHPNELVERAVRLGPDAANAYRQFLNVLAGDSVTLELQPPDSSEVAVISSMEASRDVAILGQEGTRETQRVRVPGVLSNLDSRGHQFGLSLPPDLERPPLLKGKHVVRGSFSEALGIKIKLGNLWNSEVMASLAVTYDVIGTTALPKEETYILEDVTPLLPPDKLF